ncbi:MAG: NAD-binding protein [Betaproteobacteria bacterium]|nr:NAD-binding protein [Betaproteobacteria bacterium]MDE2124514.1 NAD-binding protein [Betaproteobacteria bacterium]MDE2187296.1 NAD-binding protein [Betaproteobacteria bacterium]MDE2325267.1 NAD-binding protein [Betaproteobacteria bacterium]
MDAVCATPPMPQGMNEARSGPSQPIAVLGAGAWGTALAAALQRSGSQVTLWARRPDLVHAADPPQQPQAFARHHAATGPARSHGAR